jgi:hypothetical protein
MRQKWKSPKPDVGVPKAAVRVIKLDFDKLHQVSVRDGM